MIKQEGTLTDLVLNRADTSKNQLVILVVMHNPLGEAKTATIKVNNIVIFEQDIPYKETVIFNAEKFLLEDPATDKIEVIGEVNKMISYALY